MSNDNPIHNHNAHTQQPVDDQTPRSSPADTEIATSADVSGAVSASRVCDLFSSLSLNRSLPNQNSSQPGPSSSPSSGPLTVEAEARDLSHLTDVEMADPDELSLHPTPLSHPPSAPSSSRTPADPDSPNDTALSSQRTSSRRVRVDDDALEEDIRETNRQRLQSPETARPPVPSPPQHQEQTTTNSRILPGANPDPVPRRVVFDFFMGPRVAPPTANQQPVPQETPQPQGHGPFAQWFNHMRGQHLPFAFIDALFNGGGPGEDPDDPDRAKRLLAGLEEVSIGLVKRLQKVGGNGEADSGPGCAVCWESLLDGEGGFAGEQGKEGGQPSDEQPIEGSVLSSNPLQDKEGRCPKVVSLPCSHVFHASCLLPWFTRAHHTTCPSCRFDIDPDSLTYVPAPRPTRPLPSRRNRDAGLPATAATTPTQPQGPPPQTLAQPSTEGLRGGDEVVDYDFFVFDLMGGDDPVLVDDSNREATPNQPLSAASADAGVQAVPPQGANHPERQNEDRPLTPPSGYVGFDVSVAFSLVEPHSARDGRDNPNPAGTRELNIGTAHFHIPMFGGPLQTPQGPPPPAPAVFGPPPPPPANAEANAQGNLDDGGVQSFMQQIVDGLLAGAGARRDQPVAETPTVGQTAIPNSERPAPIPTTLPNHPPQLPFPQTAGTAPAAAPPPPTFVQFMQRLFPGFPVPPNRNQQASRPQGAQPTPVAQPTQPQPASGVPNTPQAGISPEGQAFASLVEQLVPNFDLQAPQQGAPAPRPAGTPVNNANNANNAGLGPGIPFFTFIPVTGTGAPGGLPPFLNPNMFRTDAPGAGPTPPGGPGRRTRTRSMPTSATPSGADAPPPKPQWVPPPPPGPTLRQRVEKREREMGLRCSDVSCGLGPTDDDPDALPGADVTKIRQVGIRPVKDGGDGKAGKDVVCEHRFHLPCLVSAERVAGWGGGGMKTDEVQGAQSDAEVEVSCPACRAVGCISKEAWDEGVLALA